MATRQTGFKTPIHDEKCLRLVNKLSCLAHEKGQEKGTKHLSGMSSN